MGEPEGVRPGAPAAETPGGGGDVRYLARRTAPRGLQDVLKGTLLRAKEGGLRLGPERVVLRAHVDNGVAALRRRLPGGVDPCGGQRGPVGRARLRHDRLERGAVRRRREVDGVALEIREPVPGREAVALYRDVLRAHRGRRRARGRGVKLAPDGAVQLLDGRNVARGRPLCAHAANPIFKLALATGELHVIGRRVADHGFDDRAKFGDLVGRSTGPRYRVAGGRRIRLEPGRRYREPRPRNPG